MLEHLRAYPHLDFSPYEKVLGRSHGTIRRTLLRPAAARPVPHHHLIHHTRSSTDTYPGCSSQRDAYAHLGPASRTGTGTLGLRTPEETHDPHVRDHHASGG